MSLQAAYYTYTGSPSRNWSTVIVWYCFSHFLKKQKRKQPPHPDRRAHIQMSKWVLLLRAGVFGCYERDNILLIEVLLLLLGSVFCCFVIIVLLLLFGGT